MSLPSYRKYKDSGVEWLGTIPTHWHVDRFKASIISCRNGIWGSEATGDNNDIACVRVADFDRTTLAVKSEIPTIRNVSQSERAERLLTRGNLLLEKSGGGENQPVGQVVIYNLDIPAVCSNFVAKMELAPQMFPEYWNYVHAAAYSIRLNVGSINQTSGIQNLDQTRYFEERAPFPPIDEQEAIAAFLDHETSKIDALITEQEKLLELLAEKRQATISHAVTRGLNPDVPMKDSGVEWLGVVPKHWDVIRLAQLFHEISEPGEDALPILSVSIHDGVSDGELDEDEMERKVTRSDDRSKYKRVAPGDLVYNMMRAWQGGFGSVEVPGMVSPAYVVARPIGRNFVTGYIEQLLRTAAGAKEAKRYSRGVTDFRLRLYWDEFKNICVPLPPKGEQVAIMHALDDSNARIDGLATEARTVIGLLHERRAALISAAVTGKIDVREHSSALVAAA